MKSKNRLVLICAIALVMTIAVGATLAYFYGEATVVNKFNTAGDGDDPSPTITETGWTELPTDSPDFPGDIRRKDPTLINKGGDGYGRIMIELKDKDGSLITDSKRAGLIMDMIIYTTDTLKAPEDCMDLATLKAKYPKQYNDELFVYDDARSTTGRYFYNLKDILKGNDKATLFTYVVYPTDYTKEQMELMGNFNIVVTGQMVQAKNLTKDTAMDALQKEYENYNNATPAPSASVTPSPSASVSPSPSASVSPTP